MEKENLKYVNANSVKGPCANVTILLSKRPFGPSSRTLEPPTMADLQTLATPGPASASTKKHSKKRKGVEGEANSSKTPEPSPLADLQTDTPVCASTKKHSKKRGATEASPDVKPTVEATLNVTVDASRTGGRTSTAAPAVAYFPTGYDPLAAAAAAAAKDESAPNTRLFRHEKHPTWVDLVVRSPGGGPDFVGRSYAGEAATPQLCEYALGVLDKASGTLRVVPIAANKVIDWRDYPKSFIFSCMVVDSRSEMAIFNQTSWNVGCLMSTSSF